MIEVYLNFSGQGAEAAAHYAKAFGGEITYMMRFSDMPKEAGELREGMADRVIHANVTTYAGQIMLSDTDEDNVSPPSDAMWISVSHSDHDKLRATFDALARDGEVLMPLGPTFFSPFYGQLKDKYGFHWMLMAQEA